MTFEEFSAKYLLKNPVENLHFEVNELDQGFMDPAEIDWRKQGVVSEVKNQGSCGSCWAFSAVGSLESAYALANGNLIQFSEQELVDCSGRYGNNACEGGLPTLAFKYIRDHKIGLEDDYKYTARYGSCKASKYPTRYGIKGYQPISPVNVTGLIKALNKQPVSVGIEVQEDFMHYSSGVYSNSNCGTSLNHGVTTVGYKIETDEKKSYFIIKNSWGSSWGENGYIRMQIGLGSGTCGIANEFDAYPVV